MSLPPTDQHAFAALRQFTQPRITLERCEFCGAELAPAHEHLLEPGRRQLCCCCGACGVLLAEHEGQRFRRVPHRVERLADVQIADAQWDALHIPINLAFFYHSTPAAQVLALFPSPAGATEALLARESWLELARRNPVLQELAPDVEALLVNRMGLARDYFRTSIDECYKLVGLIRARWRGLSGGTEVWEDIADFFTGLHEQCPPQGGLWHA